MKAFYRMGGRMGALMLAAALALVAGQASALTSYPDYVGSTVTYTDVQESTTSGDPEPLWGAPVGSGNQLLFFPPSFSASASGAFGYDHTGSQFQTRVTGNTPLDTITAVNITEFGDAQLFGSGGTAGTGTYAAMVGFVTVLADTSGPIAPIVIPFNANAEGGFTPSDTLDFVNDFGVTIWSATTTVDLSGLNATEIQISLDNDLYAYSESGTNASIQKKVVDGPGMIISVVPEPGTALLVASGLVILGARGRRRPLA